MSPTLLHLSSPFINVPHPNQTDRGITGAENQVFTSERERREEGGKGKKKALNLSPTLVPNSPS